MSTEHPDEGTIHAWLDGELGEAESARLAAHIAGCAACAAATAEARGLIAGASRVVASLDSPSDFTPALSATVAPTTVPTVAAAPRWPRVTPARAAIAASLLVVAGLALLHGRTAPDSALLPPPVAESPAVPAGTMAAAAPPAARDPLLDSAIKRNIAQALPPRRLERAPGPSVVPPLAPPAVASVDTTAGLRVAEGRVEAKARAETSAVAAEHVAAPLVVASAADAGAGATMRRRAMAPARATPMAKEVPMAGAAAADNVVAGRAGSCYRVDGTAPGATWGGVPLPLTVTLDDDGVWRAVGDGSVTGRWSRVTGDSVRLERGGERVGARKTECR